MAITKVDSFERFDRLAETLQGDYVAVRRDTPKLIEELEQSCLRVSENLSCVAQQCTGDEAKSICIQPNRKVKQLAERLIEANSRLEAHSVKCRACAELFHQWRDQIQGKLFELNRDSRLSDEDREICREFSVSFGPRDATWDYFAGIPAVSLFHVLRKFIDLMSSFVGQPIVLHPPMFTGLNTLIAANVDSAIDDTTFNFGSALLSTASATLYADAHQNSRSFNSSQTSLQDVLEFKRALERLEAQTFLVEAVFTTAEAAVAHAIDDTNAIARHATARLRTLLEFNRPQLF